MNTLVKKVYNYIDSHDMLKASDKVVFGLSGGADSVCLLLSLCLLSDRLMISRDDFYAVHINHMLRGDTAYEDEEFAGRFAEELGVHFICFRRDIAEYARNRHCTVEEAGREYRYRCFEDVASKYGCTKIAVAHNKNDMAETVLFNMVRGSGLNGLGGIPAVRGKVIRPLLDVTRAEIEDFLAKQGQTYRTDETNLGMDYDRNRIRNGVMPVLEQINSSAVEHICQVAEDAKDSYSYIHEQAVAGYGGCIGEGIENTVELDIGELYKVSPVLQEHMVHEALADVAGRRKDLTRRHIMSAVGLIYQDTGKSVMLPYGICARRSYDRLIISNVQDTEYDYEIKINSEGYYDIPSWGSATVAFEAYTADMGITKKIYTKMFDYGKIKGNLCIRTPKAGDYIVIDSAGRKKKLSRLFIDNKIDRRNRDKWPVLACGNEIIWAIGLRYNISYGVDDTTEKVMYIKCTRKGEEDGR